MVTAILDDLSSGALEIRPPRSASLAFCSWSFSSGKGRMCVDLRPVNFLLNRPVGFGLSTATDLALAGKHWAVKFDLKGAFESVAVPPCISGWLGFRVDGIAFTYVRLPFGWSFSPAVFQQALADSVIDSIRLARSQGVIVVIYVDDIAVAGNDPALVVHHATAVMRACRMAGWRISASKSFLRPCRILRFLGVRVRGFPSPALGIRPSFARSAMCEANNFALHGCGQHLARAWGMLSFACMVCPRLALWRSSLDAVASAVCASPSFAMPDWAHHWETVATLAEGTRRMSHRAAEGMFPILPRLWRMAMLVVDASSTGWSAVLRSSSDDEPLRTRGAFLPDQIGLGSTVRELIGPARALDHWRDRLRHCTVHTVIDNTGAVASLTSWSSSSPAARAVVAEIDAIVAEADITILPEWRSRESAVIVEVDATSRFTVPPRYAVPEATLHEIFSGGPPPSLHEGALPDYVAAPRYTASQTLATSRSGPGCRWVGTPWSRTWAGEHVFAHPSASGVSALLGRLSLEPAASLSIVHKRRWLSDSPAFSDIVANRLVAVQRIRGVGHLRDHIRHRSEDGEWSLIPMKGEWFVSRFAPEDGTRRRARSWDEIMTALIASGVEPNPGQMRTMGPGERGMVALAQRFDPFRAIAAASLLPPVAHEGGARRPSIDDVLQTCVSRDSTPSLILIRLVGGFSPSPFDSQMAAAIAEIDADRSEGTQARGDRVSAELLSFARAHGASTASCVSRRWDELGVAWVRHRLHLPGCLVGASHLRSSSPSAVLADIGAVAARLRRRFMGTDVPPTGPGLGPVTSALLTALGACARHESSPKRPVFGWELRWGIANNPDVVSTHPAAVALIVLTGASMWRSVYTRGLLMQDVFAANSYVAIRWSRRHKTNRHVGKPGVSSTAKLGFIAATWVLDIITPYVSSRAAAAPDAPMFADAAGRQLSYNYIAQVLRMLLSGLPTGSTATVHGLRVGADSELKTLGVEDHVRDWMGWWARAVRRMCELYESIDLAAVLRASGLYGSSTMSSVAPGLATSDPSLVSGAFLPPVGNREGSAVVGPVSLPTSWTAAASSATRGPRTPLSHRDGSAAAGAAAMSPSPAPDARMLPAPVHRLCPVRRYTCGNCGAQGHNRATCQRRAAAVNELGDNASESDTDSEDAGAAGILPLLPAACSGSGDAGRLMVPSEWVEPPRSEVAEPAEISAGPSTAAQSTD